MHWYVWTDHVFKKVGNTVLYIPTEAMQQTAEEASKDKKLVQRLESKSVNMYVSVCLSTSVCGGDVFPSISLRMMSTKFHWSSGTTGIIPVPYSPLLNLVFKPKFQTCDPSPPLSHVSASFSSCDDSLDRSDQGGNECPGNYGNDHLWPTGGNRFLEKPFCQAVGCQSAAEKPRGQAHSDRPAALQVSLCTALLRPDKRNGGTGSLQVLKKSKMKSSN